MASRLWQYSFPSSGLPHQGQLTDSCECHSSQSCDSQKKYHVHKGRKLPCDSRTSPAGRSVCPSHWVVLREHSVSNVRNEMKTSYKLRDALSQLFPLFTFSVHLHLFTDSPTDLFINGHTRAFSLRRATVGSGEAQQVGELAACGGLDFGCCSCRWLTAAALGDPASSHPCTHKCTPLAPPPYTLSNNDNF